jgi:hypothetical protein
MKSGTLTIDAGFPLAQAKVGKIKRDSKIHIDVF